LDIYNKFSIPETFIVDAYLSMSVDFQAMFYVSKIHYSPELLSITVSLLDGTEALVGTIQDSSFLVNLYGKNKYTGSFGKIVIGSYENMIYGEYEFSPKATYIEPCRVLKLGKGVTSINGITSGNVVFTTGSNVVIEQNGTIIKIDTQDGLCACGDIPCIKTINSIEPRNNNFEILGVGCVNIGPSESGLEIQNECEEACCGCDEINDMVDRINALQERITILEARL